MAEEQVYVQETPRRRGTRGLTGAIFLIVLGAAILLHNLGILTVNWFSIWRFWPVFLILIGLDLLLGRSVLGGIAVALVALVLLGGVVWLNSTQGGGTPMRGLAGYSITRDISESLGTVDEIALVDVRLSAGAARIGVSEDSRDVVSGRYTTDAQLDLDVNYQVQGREGTLIIRQEPQARVPVGTAFAGELDVDLTGAVPVRRLVIEAGAGDFKVDLRGLQVLESIVIKTGAGNVDLILPETGGYDVRVEAGVAQVTLTVPDSVEARLEVSAAISNVNVPDRFQSQGNRVWVTSGYESAGSGVTIRIENAIGNVQIR